MTDTAPAPEVTAVPPVEPVKEDTALAAAREAERNRYTREESLRRELEEKNRKLEAIKKNGWDIDILQTKAQTETVKTEFDAKKEVEEVKRELQVERSTRKQIEELQAIRDFASTSPEYELINQEPDAPKYIRMAMQEHYQNTGKYLSYKEACDYIEGEMEKIATSTVSKVSKTKKGEKILGLKQDKPADKSAEAEKKAPTLNTKKDVVAIPQEIDNRHLSRQNSREAFNQFRKTRGL